MVWGMASSPLPRCASAMGGLAAGVIAYVHAWEESVVPGAVRGGATDRIGMVGLESEGNRICNEAVYDAHWTAPARPSRAAYRWQPKREQPGRPARDPYARETRASHSSRP